MACPSIPARRCRALVVGALFVSTGARAHYPHDMAYWVAISPDPAEPRWATSLERINVDLMGRSENGLDWAARLVPASGYGGGVKSGAFLTPQRLVLATQQGGLQVSEDAGDTQVREPTVSDSDITRVAASPAILEDGLAFAVGETAVWRTGDAGLTWEPVEDAVGGGFTDLDLSPDFAVDGRLCALEAKALSCSLDHGKSWTRTRPPGDTFRISVGTGERLWASVRGEGLYESSDMGASWFLAGFEGEDVNAIAELGGDLVLLALAHEAEMRSTDGGVTWTQVDVLEIPFDQSLDGVNFFDFVEGPDGAIYLSCWFGLARSEDDGLTYTFFDTERVQNTHSVYLTEGLGGGIWAWIGTYGGGPILTEIRSHEAYAYGRMPTRFTRDTPITTSWIRDGTAIFDEGYDTFRTVDRGATWERFEEVSHDVETPLVNDVKGVAIAPNTTEDPFLLLSVGTGAMSFWSSEDLGETWTIGTQDPPCTELGLAAAISPNWPVESRAWASCNGGVYETVDRGQSWSRIGDTQAFVFDIAEQGDGSVLVATRDGLWRIDGESTAQIGFEGQLVVSVGALAEPGDETVFALVPTEGWMRSDDDAATWVELPAPTADYPRMISLSPHFSEDGTVAVAGYGGAWASTDRGDSWFSIYALEVYESDHDAWKTTGDWSTVNLPDASGQRVVATQQAGASRTLGFEGIDLSLVAPADAAEGVLDVSVDGGPAEQVRLPAVGGVIWQAEGLSDGWHSLRLEAVSGTVTLDALRIARIHGADAWQGSEEAGCTCRDPKQDSGTAALLLPLALLRRRRHRGEAGHDERRPA